MLLYLTFLQEIQSFTTRKHDQRSVGASTSCRQDLGILHYTIYGHELFFQTYRGLVKVGEKAVLDVSVSV